MMDKVALGRKGEIDNTSVFFHTEGKMMPTLKSSCKNEEKEKFGQITTKNGGIGEI